MQRQEISLIAFQNQFAKEEDCQRHLFLLRWPNGYRCPRCNHDQAFFHRTRHLYQCKSCGYQASLTAGTIFHKTRMPLLKWFWMIFLMGRQKSGVSMLSLQRMLDIKSYKTVWVMGHKIRKAMQERDAYYKLAGLIEMDDAFFGPQKPGKRGRGACGKDKVVVAVQTNEQGAGFAKMQRVKEVSSGEILAVSHAMFDGRTTVRTDGWPAYRALNGQQHQHAPVVVGSGKNAVRLLPFSHTLIANLKGSIRGVFHGVSSKHLPRYLAEFCFRFNRRFWESQMFERILAACVSSTTITYSELTA